MLRRELNRIQHAQHFVKVAACAHRVAELEFDFFVRADYEYCAHGGVICRCAARGGGPAFGGQHAVKLGDSELGITDHGVIHPVPLRLLDIR